MTEKLKTTTPANDGAMPAYEGRVFVSLKPTVNDPEGTTIAGALSSLGFAGVTAVRAGRYFEVSLQAEDQAAAERAVKDMCSRLLANTVIETFSFEVAPK